MKRWLRGYLAFRRLPAAKRTFFALTAAGVALAFVLIVFAAAVGDGVGVWVGLAVLAGAAGAVLLMQTIDRLSDDIAATRDHVEELAFRLDRFGRMLTALSDQVERGGHESEPGPAADGASGRGPDLASITAATLERDRFPRLASEVRGVRPGSPATAPGATSGDPGGSGAGEPPGAAGLVSDERLRAVAEQNLLRRWEASLAEADLEGCRRLLSAMVDTAELGVLDRLQGELSALEDRTEEALRSRFSNCVARRDVRGALAVGREICGLLPDRDVAAEFRRIEGRLVERVEEEGRRVGARGGS